MALPELAKERDDLYVMTADLAQLSGLERFRTQFPSRFMNAGIAEQNMLGIAAGLGLEGNTVFVTTYATFISMRCYEQIRHNLGYQRANVKLIASASGLAMGMSGNTHYAIEDIAIMRAMPGMVVLSPADATEAYLMTHAAAEYRGPVYLRLTGGLNNECVFDEDVSFSLGKARTLRDGADIAIVATGSMTAEALKAGGILQEKGIRAKVIHMGTIKPIDTEAIDDCMDMRMIITAEEHSVIGGLGGAVAEYLSQYHTHPKLYRIGINDTFLQPAEYEYLKEKYGLSAEGIVKAVLRELHADLTETEREGDYQR